jgi:hypothetical protein
MNFVMEWANRDGQMVRYTKVNGNLVKLTVEENFITPTETFMKVNGLMIKQMEPEHIHMLTVQSMLVLGKTINNMALD